MRDLEAEYERAMGRRPMNLPEDHPDAWQWDYRGSKAERDELLERLGAPVVESEEFEQVALDV